MHTINKLNNGRLSDECCLFLLPADITDVSLKSVCVKATNTNKLKTHYLGETSMCPLQKQDTAKSTFYRFGKK